MDFYDNHFNDVKSSTIANSAEWNSIQKMWLIKPLTHCSGLNWGSSIHMDLAPVNSMQVANMQNLSATTRNRPKARFCKKK